MQFLRPMAANKRAITGIKSGHYVAVMLNSAKHEVIVARDIAAEALADHLTWFSTRCDIAPAHYGEIRS